jgi:putative ABC transport system permease protein
MKNKVARPPSLAVWILSHISRHSERRAILSDFNEIYLELLKDHSLQKANLWYWSQVVKSLPMFLRLQFDWGRTMLKSYLKMSYRSLIHSKVFSFINLAGLTLGIACCVLILLWVFDEWSYDRFHANKNILYRITQDHIFEGFSASTYLPVAKHLKTDFPEVEKYVRFLSAKGTFRLDNDSVFKEDQVFYADPSLFEAFSFPLTRGDKSHVLERPNTLAISEKFAKKYFGNDNPLGEIIKYKNLEYSGESEKALEVTGVFKNIPHNSHIRFESVISLSTFDALEDFEDHGWHWPPAYTYVLLSEDRSLPNLQDRLTAFKDKHLPRNEREVRSYHLQSLKDIHLRSHLKYELGPNGDITQVYIFSVVAILIIVIACFNYINLSTARAAKRAKEVVMKKVLGAKSLYLILQFVGESFVFTLLAFIFAVGIVHAVLPFFNNLLDKNMSFVGAVNQFPLFVLVQVFFLIFISVVSGIYPALFLAKFKPAQMLQRKSHISGGALRKVLVVVQFTISIVLISGTSIIFKQMNFIQNRNLGFEKENIIVVPLWGENMVEKIPILENSLLQSPEVEKVTSYSNIIGANDRIYAYPVEAEGLPDGQQNEMSILIVDYNFVDIFSLEIVEGRGFSKLSGTDNEGIIINEAARAFLNWEKPLNRELNIKYIKKGEDFTGKVIGVVKDFNLRTLHHTVEPLAIFISDGNDVDYLLSFLSIKITTDNLQPVLAFIEKQWNSLESGAPLEYFFLDQRIQDQYQAERESRILITIFSCLAILIACSGLYGLASFVTEARTKEIGIRRVLGASISGIIFLHSREFLKWVMLANLAALPLAYFFLNRWLQKFAFRIDLGIWVFVLSAVLVLLIALLTVSYHAIKAAIANPADALRYE